MNTHTPGGRQVAIGLPQAALGVGAVFAFCELLSIPRLADVLGLSSGFLAAGALLICVLNMPAERRRPWAFLTASMGMTAVGDVIYGYLRMVRHGDVPNISFADVFYLLAYPVMMLGLLLFLRRGARRAISDVLVDAAAVAILLGIALWQVFVVSPGLLESGSALERVVAVSYPVADVLVVGGVAALALAAERTHAVRWLLVYGVSMLIADLVYLSTFQFQIMERFGPLSSALYDLSYWSLVAAALFDIRSPDATARHVSDRRTGRLPLLAIALLGAPALAVGVIALGNRSLVPVFLAAILAISTLAMMRLIGLVRGLERERELLQAAEARLAHEAKHDALTGLPNRSLLSTRLPELVREARAHGGSVSVIFLDLDEFKQVNDTLGHHAGDALLRLVGARITAEIGTQGVVARVGGDEFVLICPEVTNEEDAAALSDRLIAAIQAPMYLGEHRVQTSASIGYAVLDADTDHHVLLRNADLALFDAKAAGRRTARRFTPDLRTAADERAELEQGLRRSVDDGTLSVMYQPRVCLESGAVRSLEALLRWPSRPEVSIVRVIEIAEATGLIIEIGRFVLDRAVRDIAEINLGRTRPVAVAVNVSMRQLARPEFADEIIDALERHGVDHRHLILEITETLIAHEPNWVRRGLGDLRDAGVRIEVDDFGTGYSSFLRLTQLPIDGIKIDQTFARDLADDPRADQMVAAMVALARVADVAVTIEGIERRAQLDAARRLGCDLAQGFLFSRPVTLEQAERLIADVRPWTVA